MKPDKVIWNFRAYCFSSTAASKTQRLQTRSIWDPGKKEGWVWQGTYDVPEWLFPKQKLIDWRWQATGSSVIQQFFATTVQIEKGGIKVKIQLKVELDVLGEEEYLKQEITLLSAVSKENKCFENHNRSGLVRHSSTCVVRVCHLCNCTKKLAPNDTVESKLLQF